MKKNQLTGENIKELLNINNRVSDRKWNKKNLETLKLIEEKKKRNKEQKEIEKELQYQKDQYKLEIFKNIPSKLKENTKNWITNEQAKNKPVQKKVVLAKIRTKSLNKPLTGLRPNKAIKAGENIYNVTENEPKSMFDKYYADKLRSKSPLIYTRQYENNNYEENDYLKQDININNNEALKDININNNENDNIEENTGHKAEIDTLIKEYKEKFGTDEEIQKLLNDYNNNLELNQPENNIDKINDNNSEPAYQLKKIDNLKPSKPTTSNNNRRRDVHKAPTPTINDAPIILPKIHKNYIRENRQLVSENKVPTKTKLIEEKNDAKHKDYGKVPEYIKKYELEREIRKEEIKKQEEAAKYPKGTKLLTEEERVEALNGLMNSKKELINILEKRLNQKMSNQEKCPTKNFFSLK